MSKVLITENYLDAIADAIRGRNGTQNTYTPAQMAAAVAAIPNAYVAGDEGKVVSNGALVAQSSSSVTQNGTVDTTLINSLTVNVSGGESNVIVSNDPPSPSVGSVGQYYIYVRPLTTIPYGIKIEKAGRNTQTNFTYWGARDIDFVFTDGETEYHLRNFTGATAAWASGEANSFSTQNANIDGNTSQYNEHNGLPGYYSISAEVPSGLALSKVRICGRNDSNWPDYWITFSIGQIAAANSRTYINTLISESDLTLADWDMSSTSAYTEFELATPVAPFRYDYALYLKMESGWMLIAT